MICSVSVFEPDGPKWVKPGDPEANIREEDEQLPKNELITPNLEVSEDGVTAKNDDIVVSHPRRRNHRINEIKKSSPPMTPSKASNETSSCLVERRL